ncbi:MAG TPA: PRC-barrel domain-containing protein, partial [Actinoplanes sp.]|nr:PRC-barrel domain-containing protein [Actinoplanes sp.]
EPAGTMAPLSDTGQIIADPGQDVRGRSAVDGSGEKIGTVADLLVDTVTNHVRFLRVEHGGILGFGASSTFIPAEAVREVSDDTVYFDSLKDHIAGGPRYDPEMVDQRDYYGEVYEHYGRIPGAPAGYLSGIPYSPGLPPVR